MEAREPDIDQLVPRVERAMPAYRIGRDNRFRVDGDKRTDNIEPRSDFPDASVGRSDRSAQCRWLWTGRFRRQPRRGACDEIPWAGSAVGPNRVAVRRNPSPSGDGDRLHDRSVPPHTVTANPAIGLALIRPGRASAPEAGDVRPPRERRHCPVLELSRQPVFLRPKYWGPEWAGSLRANMMQAAALSSTHRSARDLMSADFRSAVSSSLITSSSS
jgi:hypothetical protein